MTHAKGSRGSTDGNANWRCSYKGFVASAQFSLLLITTVSTLVSFVITVLLSCRRTVYIRRFLDSYWIWPFITWIIAVFVDTPTVARIDDGTRMIDRVPPFQWRQGSSTFDARSHNIDGTLSSATCLRKLLYPCRRTCWMEMNRFKSVVALNKNRLLSVWRMVHYDAI